MSTVRTITLTDRAPVRVSDEVWPMIASASDKEHDGDQGLECRANRTSKWFIGVRQHEDGRHLIYASYHYATNWANARGFSARHGVIVPSGDNVIAAIHDLTERMGSCEHHGEDAARWSVLRDECIASFPVEDLE